MSREVEEKILSLGPILTPSIGPKLESKASIIASTVFAIPLILAAVEVIPATAADILLAGLTIMFGAKYFRSWKFMPGGMMGIASLVAFVMRLLLQSPTP